MSFLDVSRKYLQRLSVPFEVIRHKPVESTFQVASAAAVPVQRIVKTLLLADKQGAVLVSLPANQGLDFEALNRRMMRSFSLAQAKTYQSKLMGFPPMMLSPWHRLFNLPWIVEESLLNEPRLYITSGTNSALIQMEADAFRLLSEDATFANFGRIPKAKVDENGEIYALLDRSASRAAGTFPESVDLQERIEKGLKLPVLPNITAELLAIKQQDEVDTLELAHLIESDPVLTVNILHYASSPFFAYEGDLLSVKEAIWHVLGVRQTLDIAIGLSLCSHIEGPKSGPLGLRSLWRDAVYSAILAQRLGAAASPELKLDPGAAYLAGLLHNIGYLMMAQAFPKEYELFNRLLAKQPSLFMRDLEGRVMGFDHQSAGELLLQDWKLSHLLAVVARHHHDAAYEGEFAPYVHLIGLVDCMLCSMDMGDAAAAAPEPHRLNVLGVTEEDMQRCIDELTVHRQAVEFMARRLVS